MESRMEREGRDLNEQAKSAAAEMAEKVKEAGQRMGPSWEEYRANLQEKTLAGARAADRAIHEYPYASLGIAFGIGLLIGVLATRGSK
jgi:ElaB/YqjD/DUF883 family membrane-anchored ribosome-binding protein